MLWHVRVTDDGLGVLIEEGERGTATTIVYFAVTPENADDVEVLLKQICDAHNRVVESF
jgi:hypothetical protein